MCNLERFQESLEIVRAAHCASSLEGRFPRRAASLVQAQRASCLASNE